MQDSDRDHLIEAIDGAILANDIELEHIEDQIDQLEFKKGQLMASKYNLEKQRREILSD